MAKYDDLDLQQVETEETLTENATEHTNADKAEWVALMCVIGKSDRDLYRKLRAEAWESVLRSGWCSTKTN
jgi:hypothetical protein